MCTSQMCLKCANACKIQCVGQVVACPKYKKLKK